MMSATPWGYEVDLEAYEGALPPIITLEEFHDLTGNAFSQDERIEREIAAISARFRTYCGWHIWPSLSCTATLDGGERCVWLPATNVTALASVTVSGTALDVAACQWSRIGQLRLPPTPDVLSSVAVAYTAGFADCPEDLALLVAHRVVHNVAMPFGIASETVGRVSRSYVTSMASDAGGPNLTRRDRDTLATWRIEEAV